jgi:pyridinium-3,5-bisthiocarboxylic acid mononucleotide nickel chelatase
VKARATRAFQLLGEAEAAIHSIPIEKVHFHEVGAVDTIVDIVCAAAGAKLLGVDRWLSSPLNVGSGTVVCQHGTLPFPRPPRWPCSPMRPSTPPGRPWSALRPPARPYCECWMCATQPLPAMRIKASGYGAGGRDTPGEPNLLRLLVGEESEQPEETESIAVIETVIDDSSPQLLAYVSELLLAAGAWDVYRVAVQMKKGRTGVQVTVLCRPDLVPILRDLLFRETTTIGLHWRSKTKSSLAREFHKVKPPGAKSIKIARWPNGEVANASPEYEDCRRLAASTRPAQTSHAGSHAHLCAASAARSKEVL